MFGLTGNASASAVLAAGRHFFDWWWKELVGLLPERLRRLVLLRGRRLVLSVEGTELVAREGVGSALEQVARYDLVSMGDEPGRGAERSHATEVVYCLPVSEVLVRRIDLPLAAQENLREVLAFEMDRQTPFSVGQVYYDFQVVGRDRRRNRLEAKLVVAPRQIVDQELVRLDRLGYRPDVVSVASDDEDCVGGVNLLPPERRSNRRGPGRLNLALGGVVVVLLVAVLGLPLVQKQQAIAALRPQLDAARKEAEAARALRETTDTLEAQARFLVEKKGASLLLVQVLNEVTRILPDDTWVQRLEMRGDELQIYGESKGAALLISLLESSPLFENVSFRSPVTQVPRGEGERFHISAAILREGST